jgi:hypothetical protein
MQIPAAAKNDRGEAQLRSRPAFMDKGDKRTARLLHDLAKAASWKKSDREGALR